jgi:hypothetical protein
MLEPRMTGGKEDGSGEDEGDQGYTRRLLILFFALFLSTRPRERCINVVSCFLSCFFCVQGGGGSITRHAKPTHKPTQKHI